MSKIYHIVLKKQEAFSLMGQSEQLPLYPFITTHTHTHTHTHTQREREGETHTHTHILSKSKMRRLLI